MKAAAIIPARFASTRLPGKPLVDIAGKSMIQRVYQRVQQTPGIEEVLVATDDERIRSHVEAFGGKAVHTSSAHRSGTDRCAEAAESLSADYNLILNVQGDEPLIDPRQITQLLKTLQGPGVQIATLIKTIQDEHTLMNHNSPKVVLDIKGRALYFSRQPLPYYRGLDPVQWLDQQSYYHHIGIYGFNREVLKELTRLAPSSLEKAEGLEQLRWLEHGYAIHTGITEIESIAVDTPEDLQQVRGLFSQS